MRDDVWGSGLIGGGRGLGTVTGEAAVCVARRPSSSMAVSRAHGGGRVSIFCSHLLAGCRAPSRSDARRSETLAGSSCSS
jgi:hypothetical protein